MNLRLAELLTDPNDGNPLETCCFEGTEEDVRSGALVNPLTRRWYPVEDGIPSLFADALRPDDLAFRARFGDQLRAAGCGQHEAASSETAAQPSDLARIDVERRARDEQAEAYDNMLSLRIYEQIEIPAYKKALRHAPRGWLLEAGCGTGRFTGVFAEMAHEVLATDMSRDSILRNRVRHTGKTASLVHYVHADLTHLPLRTASFDCIAHCGVYEHIPNRDLRQQFLAHARRVLRPEGVFLLSAYRYGGITRLFGKQGEHPGGIPFTRFSEAELREELAPYFKIQTFRPSLGVYMSMLTATGI